MTRNPIEIQRSDVRRSWRSKEPKVVQRNENKPEVEMRARKAAARNNAARPSLSVPLVERTETAFHGIGNTEN